MINLKSITLDQFLCIPNLTVTGPVVDQFGMMQALFRDHVGGAFHDLGDGYFLHRLGEKLGDVCVLHDGQLVGFYQGQLVAVDPLHGGKGVGTAMILTAVKHRNLPSSRVLSSEGKATLTKAWNVANGSASVALDVRALI